MLSKSVAASLVVLLGLARADVDLELDNVPQNCRSICNPIVQLTRACDVDLRGDNDRDEDLLKMQCVCTNDSFDVAQIAGLCADCIRQYWQVGNHDDHDHDDDDHKDRLDDIQDLISTCGFNVATGTFDLAASTAANSVTVVATAPTNIAQLTTTIVPGRTDLTSARDAVTGTGTATATAAATATGSAGAQSTSSTQNAAAPTIPPLGLAGALVAGAMLLA